MTPTHVLDLLQVCSVPKCKEPAGFMKKYRLSFSFFTICQIIWVAKQLIGEHNVIIDNSKTIRN